MVVLGTAATAIASQAVITAFSVAHQFLQLGYLPRLHWTHNLRPDLPPLDQLGLDGLGADAGLRLPDLSLLAYAFEMAVTGGSGGGW